MPYKYNPGFLTDEDSVHNFVVRHKDLQIISEILRDNTQSSSNRHVLIVGPRGSGKSTLARRLVAEVRRNSDLSRHWHPIVLGEESYTIASAGEFWLEAVFQLAEQSGRADLHSRYRELQSEKDEVRLRELALGAIVAFATQRNCRILLVVENLNMLLEEQMDAREGWTIRHALHNVPEVMLLATATRTFDDLVNVEKALYEQFKVHELRPLGLRDVSTLWASLTRDSLGPRKVRPLQILTGGSPRLIVILGEFAVGHSFTTLMSRLSSLIDQYTDYFKSQLDSLPAAERKVFVTLLEKWDPATTREIADEARVPVNSTSAQLNRLRSRGAVLRRSIGGIHYWEASERLFNLYYLMRRRGAPSSRVNALVKFMTVYYETDQLYERATDLARECGSLRPELRRDHYSALEQILTRFDASKRAQLLSLSPPEFAKRFENASAPGTVSTSTKNRTRLLALSERVFESLRQERVEDAAKLLEKGPVENRVYGSLWAVVAHAYGRIRKDFDTADSLFTRAYDLDSSSPVVRHFHGLSLQARGRHSEAIEKFRQAIGHEAKFEGLWIALGESYEAIGDLDAAEEAYRAAIKTEDDSAEAWYALGEFLASHRKDVDAAEKTLRKAVDLKPRSVNYLGTLGNFLRDVRGDYRQAELIFRRMLELDSTDSRAWASLIETLARAGSLPDAMSVEFKHAMQTEGLTKKWRVSSAYADYLNGIHEHRLAEQVLKEATTVDPGEGRVWLDYAVQVAPLDDKRHEALSAFSKALELLPDKAQAWVEFGNFLSVFTDRSADAEGALRKAVQLDSRSCRAWKTLGEHYLKSDNSQEAADCFKRAIDVNPNCVCSIDGYAATLVKRTHGLAEVFELIAGFMKRVPEQPGPHIALAKYQWSIGRDRKGAIENILAALKKGAPSGLLVEQFLDVLSSNDSQDSVEILGKYIELSGDNARTLNQIAWALYERKSTGPLLSLAVSLSKSTVEQHPDNWAFRHTLACLLFASNCVDESLREVVWLADHIGGGSLEEFIALCVCLTRKGQRDKLLKLLVASTSRESFEPLIVALKLVGGNEPNVAREVLEVARDILKQIQDNGPADSA